MAAVENAVISSALPPSQSLPACLPPLTASSSSHQQPQLPLRHLLTVETLLLRGGGGEGEEGEEDEDEETVEATLCDAVSLFGLDVVRGITLVMGYTNRGCGIILSLYL